MATRKELIQEYKETWQPMGVFCVRNTRNGKRLIGSSQNLPGIFNRERFLLRMNGHRNKSLQEDWNSAGSDAFVFEVLETLDPLDAPDYDPRPDLRFLLEHWLEELRPYGAAGYNMPGR